MIIIITLFHPHSLPTNKNKQSCKRVSLKANALLLTPGGDISTSDQDSDRDLLVSFLH